MGHHSQPLGERPIGLEAGSYSSHLKRESSGAARNDRKLMNASPLLAAFLVALASAPCRSQDSRSIRDIEAALRRFPTAVIGQFSEDSIDSVLVVLHRHPALAAERLVGRLAPVARGRHHPVPRVVWYIRALRSLTGLDFEALTNAALTDDEQSYLRTDSLGRVRFFGWHMAWDETWLAPRDAQATIIAQWQRWFARTGKSFKYVNDPNHDHWLY